jgi:hypothetical protein
MNFFVDRCLPPSLAEMLAVHTRGVHRVRHLSEDNRFRHNTPDEEWMRTLAADDPPWVVITRDISITRNIAEREVVRDVQLQFFFLAKRWGEMSMDEMVWRFFKVWPEILRKAADKSARVFEVSGSTNLSVRRLQI